MSSKFKEEGVVTFVEQDSYVRPSNPYRECNCRFCDGPESRMQYDTRVADRMYNGAPLFSMRTHDITIDALWKLNKQFELTNIDRRNRHYRMGEYEFRELVRSPEFTGVASNNMNTGVIEIFGISVEIAGRQTGYIELRETI